MPTVRVHLVNQTREPAFRYALMMVFERVPFRLERIDLSEYPPDLLVSEEMRGVYLVQDVITFPAFGTSRVELVCHLELQHLR